MNLSEIDDEYGRTAVAICVTRAWRRAVAVTFPLIAGWMRTPAMADLLSWPDRHCHWAFALFTGAALMSAAWWQGIV